MRAESLAIALYPLVVAVGAAALLQLSELPRRIAVRQSPGGTFNEMAPDPEPLVTYPWLAAELGRRGIGFLHLFDLRHRGCPHVVWLS